jgi:hypothetical protein
MKENLFRENTNLSNLKYENSKQESDLLKTNTYSKYFLFNIQFYKIIQNFQLMK